MRNLLYWTRLVQHRTAIWARQTDFRRSRRWLAIGGGALADLVFPPRCLLCGDELIGGAVRICLCCRQQLLNRPTDHCPRCAKPLPDGWVAEERGCPQCHSKRLWYARTICVGVYGDAVRDMVIRMKQSRYESLSLAAGELLTARVQQEIPDRMPDIVTAVPMHWWRRISRGVNAAELLAEKVASGLRRPLSLRLLRCRRRTRKQGTLTPNERRKNVRGAYAMARRRSLEGKHVLLIDDVMTTGATANELSKLLIRSGAREVSVAVFARGVGFQ